MKFTNQFVTLLGAVSFVYSHNIKRGDVLNILRRDLTFDENKIDEAKVPIECDISFRPYAECIDQPTKYNKVCEYMASDKCVKFYNDPFGAVPGCRGVDLVEQFFEPTVFKSTIVSMKLLCLKDENGNYCPFTEVLLSDKEADLDTIEETCKSKICTDGTLEVYNTILYEGGMSSYENLSYTKGNFSDDAKVGSALIVEHLSSEKCKSSHVLKGSSNLTFNNHSLNSSSNSSKTSSDDISNDALIVKVGSTVLISVG